MLFSSLSKSLWPAAGTGLGGGASSMGRGTGRSASRGRGASGAGAGGGTENRIIVVNLSGLEGDKYSNYQVIHIQMLKEMCFTQRLNLHFQQIRLSQLHRGVKPVWQWPRRFPRPSARPRMRPWPRGETSPWTGGPS